MNIYCITKTQRFFALHGVEMASGDRLILDTRWGKNTSRKTRPAQNTIYDTIVSMYGAWEKLPNRPYP